MRDVDACRFNITYAYYARMVSAPVFLRIGDNRRPASLAKFESVLQNLVRALNNGDKGVRKGRHTKASHGRAFPVQEHHVP
jgi:hypothetical protein